MRTANHASPADHADRRRPVAVDLFSGAGGLSLGLEQAGFDVLASVEYDPVHAATHAFNFPQSDVLATSVARVGGSELLAAAGRGWRRCNPGVPWPGELDLVAGGPPCQGFSWIGKRHVDDERNDLIFHFWRLVHELRPRYFVMENVPGMLSGAHRALLGDLLDRFADDGYKVQPPAILQAADYGVPQSRRRLVLIGSREDVAVAGYPFPATRAAGPAGIAAGGRQLPAGPSVREAIGELPDLDGFEVLLGRDSVRLSRAQLSRMARLASPYAGRLSGALPDEDDLSFRRSWDPAVLSSSMRTVHTDRSVLRFDATPPGVVEPVSRFLRLDPGGVCNTLRAGTGAERGAFTSPRPIHPWLPRVISVREAARLHSFPDWFRLHVTKWHGFRQVGNSVPPLLGRAVGQAVVAALGLSPRRPERALPAGDERLLSMTMAEAAEFFGVPASALPGQRSRRSC